MPNASHNYLPALLRFLQRQNLPPSSVNDVMILHDDWCDMIQGKGNCNCSPEFKLKQPCHLQRTEMN